VNVFTRHLAQKGHSLKLYDADTNKSRGLAGKLNCAYIYNLVDATRDVEMVLLCTPTEDTPAMIQGIGPLLEHGTLVCEIASLKMGTVPALRRLNCLTLSLHPMFGPDVTSFNGQTMALVHVKDDTEEAEAAKMLFPETKLVQVSAESHDKVMAYVLSLPYFMNLAFAHALDSRERDLMKELAGTTFKAQSIVTDCVIGESPDLVKLLINGNMYSWDVINNFIQDAQSLKRLFMGGGDVEGYYHELQKHVGDFRLLEARMMRNQMIKKEEREIRP
jgi:prephenate dehydrogenase